MADKTLKENLKEQKALLADIELAKQRIVEINKTIALAEADEIGDLQKKLEKHRLTLSYAEEINDTLAERIELQKKELSAAKTSAEQFSEFVDAQSIAGGMTEKISKGYKDINKSISTMASLAGSNADDIKAVAEISNKILSVETLRNDVFAAKLAGNEDEAKLLADKLVTSATELEHTSNSLIHNEAISKQLLKIYAIQQQIAEQKELTAGLTKAEYAAYEDIIDSAEKLKMKLMSTANVITNEITGALKRPSLAIGGLIMGFGAIVGKVGAINKRLGVGADFLNENRYATAGLSMVFDEAGDSMRGLVTTMGDSRKVTPGMQLDTNLIATNLGIAGEEAAELLAAFGHISGQSFETSENTLKSLQQTAKLRGVTPSAVFKDIAGHTEFFAKYSKDGGKNIGMAAISARQLGLDLGAVEKITESLLDFESSIEKELEASALLGRDLNFQRARELAMVGDIEGMNKEVVRQLGTQAVFDKMSVYEKKAAAEALGLSVEELQKIYANQKNLEENQGFINSSFSTMGELITMAANSWAGGMVKGIGGAIVLAGQLGTGFSALMPMISKMKAGIADMASSAWKWVKALIQGKTLSTVNTFAGGSVSVGKDILAKSVAEKAASVGSAGPVPDISKKTEMVNKGSKFNAGSMLKGAAAILILSAALWVAAKAFQEFSDVEWPKVALGLGAIAGLAVISSLLGASTPLMLEGALAIAVLGASLIPFAYALSLLSPVINSFGTAIGQIFTTIVPVISTIGTVISTIITSISDGITAVVGSISSLVTTILPLANMEAAGGMLAFAGSIVALSTALTGFAFAGLMATPAMIAVGTFAKATSMEGESGEGGTTGADTMDALLAEIKGLRQDLTSGKVAVNIDGYKLTSRISKIVESSPITGR